MPSPPVALDTVRHSPHVARKRRAQRRRILAAALAIFREEGRHALTVKQLAVRLGQTPAALYRYFPSKDALVAELQRVVIASLATSMRERAARAAELAEEHAVDPAQAALLPAVVTALGFEAFARTAPVEFGLLAMDLGTPEYMLPEREAARVFEAAWKALSELARRLDAAAHAGALAPGPAPQRAVALWAGLQGVAQTRKLVRSASQRIDPTRISHDLLQSLLVGWGADPACVTEAVAFSVVHGLAAPPPSTLEMLEAPEA